MGILHHLGRAFSALGRKEEAILVWEKGHEHALHQSADLKQLLELEELLAVAKQEKSIISENHATESELSMLISESESENHATESESSMLISGSGPENHATESESSMLVAEPGLQTSENSSETFKDHHNLSDDSKLCSESRDKSEVYSKSGDNFEPCNGIKDDARGKKGFSIQMNGNHNIHDKSSYESESSNDSSDTCNKLSIIPSSSSDMCNNLSIVPSSSSDLIQKARKLSCKAETSRNEVNDESKRNKKFCVTRISKTKSISVDFRLSRGIAEVSCDAVTLK